MRTVSKNLLSIVILVSCCQGAEEIAGCIKMATAGAMVVRAGQELPATEGMHLLPNDVLRTSANGRLSAILQDGTGIGLGPSTELKIDSFLYQPAEGKLALVLRLFRGVMAYFSGRIAKLAPGSVTVETPVGVLGLRGTHVAVSLGGVQ